MLCTRAALGRMTGRSGGTIVDVASNVAKRGLPHRAACVASKGALLGFTHTVALQTVEHGIRVNAICPGPVEIPHLDEVMPGHAVAEGTTLILACSNARLIEFDAYGGPGWDGMLVEPYTMKAGHVTADERPGLGVELTDDAFERFSLLRR